MSSNPFDIAQKKFELPSKLTTTLNNNYQNYEDFEEETTTSNEKSSPFDEAENKRKQPVSFETYEDLERQIDKSKAKLTSRGIEVVAGLPGDVVNFVRGLFGKEPHPWLPDSKELQKFSEKITGGYTAPENEFEQKTGEAFQDIATMALPGAKHYSIARNIGIPIAANLAKEGVNRAGGSEKTQNFTKLAINVILDLILHRRGLGTAKEVSGKLFQEADKKIPKGLSINSSNLERNLTNLEKNLSMGGSRPDTAEALQKISEIKSQIKYGKIDLKELVAYRPSINLWIDKYKGFDIAVPDKIRRKIINNLQNVKGEVINAAEEYGKKYNPEYLKLSQNANSSWQAIEQSNKISKFIEKTASSKIKSVALKSVLGLAGTAAYGGTGVLLGMSAATGLGGAGMLGYKALKTMIRAKNPVLLKHYGKILEGAAKGNAAQVIKNVKFLDDSFLEMEETGELSAEDDND
jgi:hypothetical protein